MTESATAYPSDESARASLDDGVLRLVLDRPKKRNAIDDVGVATLIAALERARHGAPERRAIVRTFFT